jgi:hypothetical protein
MPELEEISAGTDRNGSELYRLSTISELYTFSNTETSVAAVLVSNAKVEAEAHQPTDVALWPGGETWWPLPLNGQLASRGMAERGPRLCWAPSTLRNFAGNCRLANAFIAHGLDIRLSILVCSWHANWSHGNSPSGHCAFAASAVKQWAIQLKEQQSA